MEHSPLTTHHSAPSTRGSFTTTRSPLTTRHPGLALSLALMALGSLPLSSSQTCSLDFNCPTIGSGTTGRCLNGNCVECEFDFDCDSSVPACKDDGTCVQCEFSSDCPGSATCNFVTNNCESSCSSNSDCSGSTPICSSNTCVACASDADCSGSTPNCHSSTKTCVGCESNSDCAADETCRSSSNTCIECESDSDCSGSRRCLTSSLTCVECLSDSDCTSGTCSSNACSSGSSDSVDSADSPSTTADSAGSPSTTAAPSGCVLDSECSASTPKCLLGTCKECAGDSDCSQSSAPYCLSSGVCSECQSSECSSSDPTLMLVIGVAAGAVLIIAIVVFVFFKWRKPRQVNPTKDLEKGKPVYQPDSAARPEPARSRQAEPGKTEGSRVRAEASVDSVKSEFDDHKYLVSKLTYGSPALAAGGLLHALGMSPEAQSQALRDGIGAIEREFNNSGNPDLIDIFRYCYKGVAGDPEWFPAYVKEDIRNGKYYGGLLSEGDFDYGNKGMTFEDFCNHENCKMAQLSPAMVLAIRIYTTKAYRQYNKPLRDNHQPHPLAATVYFAAEGIKLLRAVQAKVDPKGFKETMYLFRGMKNRQVDNDIFLSEGGTEAAFMSTTCDKQVAIRYGHGESTSLLFHYKTSGLNRGVPIKFLSCYPKEEEFLYPPLTYLRPEGEPVAQEDGFTVYEIVPQMA